MTNEEMYLRCAWTDGFKQGKKESEKEIAELKKQLADEKDFHKSEVLSVKKRLGGEVGDLEDYIEKMKCCGNCKYLNRTCEPMENTTQQYQCTKGGFSMGHCEEWECKYER